MEVALPGEPSAPGGSQLVCIEMVAQQFRHRRALSYTWKYVRVTSADLFVELSIPSEGRAGASMSI